MSHARTSSASRGYDAAWRRLRLRFLAEHPLCVMCERQGRTVAANIVDHVEAIAKAPHRRLDWANLQALCQPCHDSVKQREERGRPVLAVGVDGMPIDPRHPWNR